MCAAQELQELLAVGYLGLCSHIFYVGKSVHRSFSLVFEQMRQFFSVQRNLSQCAL